MSADRVDSGGALRCPVDLVTGFLGSGKTTLINAVLRDPGFAQAMVIVNEFGSVGLDHLLMGRADDQVLLLDSGCLCCAVSGNLRDTLIDLLAGRASGRVPPFSRLIVETSGLANPGPLIATLLADSALAPRCELQQVLTLVDAEHGAHTLAQHDEARRQVALADRLLITKAEALADTAALPRLQTLLRELNPGAPIEQRDPPAAPLAHFQPIAAAGQARPAPALRGPLRAQYAGDTGAAGLPLHGSAFARIRTQALAVPQTLDWPTYAAWTAGMRQRFGTRLLRCKGLLAIGDAATPWVVQGVQGHFTPPARLPAWPAATAGRGFLVLIVEGAEAAELNAALAALQAQATEQAERLEQP